MILQDIEHREMNDPLKEFEFLVKNPTAFLSVQYDLKENARQLLKKVYDSGKSLETRSQNQNNSLPSLVIENFDNEQIWQQLELQNQSVQKTLRSNFIKIADELENSFDFDADLSDDSQDEDDGCEQNNASDSVDSDYSSDDASHDEPALEEENELELSENDEQTKTKPKELKSKSAVDDKFFNLSYMENVVLNENNEQKSIFKGEEDIFFQDTPSSDDNDPEDSDNEEKSNDPKYSDFFDDPEEDEDAEGLEDEKNVQINDGGKLKNKRKLVRFNLDNVDDTGKEVKSTNETKSSLEERQERLKKRIEKLEEDALAEKPWQLKGEVTAKKRPQNSLLEEVLEFDMTSRPAPIITEEVALKMEDIIIRRIKDKAWDDVERKIKPVDTPYEFKKKIVLNQEKSKMSLAQIYEQEYMKQKEAANPGNKYKEEEEPKEHKQVRIMMDNLFRKLDALSNYHYTPKPAIPELTVVNNLPAVTMEEAIPETVSDATLLAPEELQAKHKGNLIGKEERTSTDKKRDRRHKKQKQRQKKKEIEQREKYLSKLKPGMGNKYTKEKLRKELETLSKSGVVSKFQEKNDGKAGLKSSKSFFDHLQDTVNSNAKTLKRKNTYGNSQHKGAKRKA